MQSFIKVSNRIFTFKLSPKAIMVYVYLCSRKDKFQSAIVKLDTISKHCNMSKATVQSAIAKLITAGFIKKVNRYNSRGYLSNRYYLKDLLKDNVGWFSVPTEVFSTAIRATDFLVYCCIRRCMCNRRKEAFPSLSAIAETTRVSRGRVSQAVQFLRNFTYINRVRRKYKQTKAYRHNRYMQFKINQGKKKSLLSNTNPQLKIILKANYYKEQAIQPKSSIARFYGEVNSNCACLQKVNIHKRDRPISKKGGGTHFSIHILDSQAITNKK